MKNKLLNSIQIQFYWLFALMLLFWVMSAFEVLSNLHEESIIFILKTISLKFLNDFWAVFLVATFFLPITFLFEENREKLRRSLMGLLGIIIVLIQLSLIKYSLVSKVNLGSDLLGYSYDDIVLTVSSSTSFSLVSILSFVVMPLLFLGALYFFRKKLSKKVVTATFVFLLALTLTLQLFFSEINDTKYQNKSKFLVSDIYSSKSNQNQTYTLSNISEYPLLKPIESSKDVLKPFFKIDSLQRKPNIVIVIMEGLGSEFIDNNSYGGFSPFIDSLLDKSLYWENFLSTTGRTFGVLPSLLGSLPYGEMGFLEIKNTPKHVSLFSVLKENGYTNSYYTGSRATFDNVFTFLQYNEVNNIIDENKFGFEYKKAAQNDEGFSWGYPDSELFRKVLETPDKKNEPRLDVLLTVSNHEPFSFPNKLKYESAIDSIFKANKKIKISQNHLKNNKDIYAALNYVDHSLKNFLKEYEKRDDYKNTIFIITGDHRLIPIPQKDLLCRFHVPLIIYSPLLKNPQRFKSISSHWDVTPTLVSFLKNNYQLKTKEQTAWMGSGLDTTKTFRNTHQLGLMRYKGSLKDFVYKNYFYSDQKLFKINSDFNLAEIRNAKKLEEVKDSFNYFKELNRYVTQKNKIIPDSLKSNSTIKKIIFSEDQLAKINQVAEGKNVDEIFIIARTYAFEGEREFARLLADYVLSTNPYFVDIIILKGRTLAWDGKYDEAEKTLLDAINKFPYYDDPYLALMDTYYWSDQSKKCIELGKNALKNQLKNLNINFKMAKAYNSLNDKKTSIKIIDSLVKLDPKNEEFLKFKKALQ